MSGISSLLWIIKTSCKENTIHSWNLAPQPEGRVRTIYIDLFCVPVAVTINFCTNNLEYLESHDWLGNPGNRVIVQLSQSFASSI